MVVMRGIGFGVATLNVSVLDAPPPGVGLTTRTLTAPAVWRSELGICAVNCVPLLLATNVVMRLAPFHCTTAPGTKFAPVTCRVKAVEPTAAEFGLIVVSVGTGLTI